MTRSACASNDHACRDSSSVCSACMRSSSLSCSAPGSPSACDTAWYSASRPTARPCQPRPPRKPSDRGQTAAPGARNRCAGPAAARPCHRRAHHNRRARSAARTCRCRCGRSAPPFRQRRAGNPHGQAAARGQKPARRQRESGTAWALSLPWRWVTSTAARAASAGRCLPAAAGRDSTAAGEAPEAQCESIGAMAAGYQANAEANARAAPSQPR
jgi:hypothetical protein